MRNTRIHHLHKDLRYLLTHQVHTDGMGLHHRRLSIDINDQARKVIALTMYQTIGVILWVIGNTDGETHLQCRRQTGIPERMVDLNVRESQYTDSNRTLLIMSDSDEIALKSDDTYQLAFLNTIVHPLDSPGEHPRMETTQALILPLP